MRDAVQKVVVAAPILIVSVFSIGAPSISREPLPKVVPAVAAPDSNPSICIGFNAEKSAWGATYNECPAGYAYYGTDDPGGPNMPGEFMRISEPCCPLPAKDILTAEHVWSDVSCPEGYIATGQQNTWSADEVRKPLRCTKINTERYKLGELTHGVYWGNGFAGWQGAQRIEREKIPAAIRYGAGRVKKDEWDVDGCIGYPFGSLLTKKTSKFCGGMYFRQLQFVGKAGDPPAGTPVKMFPDCSDVTNNDDPANAHCVG